LRRPIFCGTCHSHPTSGHVERSGAQSRHLPESSGHNRKCHLRGGLSTPPRRQSGLRSRRRWFVGIRLPRPLTGPVERSAAKPRRRIFCRTCLSHPNSGHVERSGAQSRHLPESSGHNRKCHLRGGLSAPPRRQSGLRSRRRWFVGIRLPRPLTGRVERSDSRVETSPWAGENDPAPCNQYQSNPAPVKGKMGELVFQSRLKSPQYEPEASP